MGYVLVLPSKLKPELLQVYTFQTRPRKNPPKAQLLQSATQSVLESGKKIGAPVKVGDKVIYKKWGGDEIKLKWS